MTTSYSYTIIIHPEDGQYWVSVPTLPGCYTQGNTVQEAISRAKEAIALYLEVLKEDGKPVPVEPEHPLAVVIDVAA